MARAPNELVERARAMYRKGTPLKEIAEVLGVSPGTVRSWKNRYKWDPATLQKKERNVAEKKCNVAEKKRGGQSGNKNARNAKGKSKNARNRNAEKHGFFTKWLPEETMEIMGEMEEMEPIDILWQNIQLQYAGIIRAQRIMYVQDKNDMAKEMIEAKKGAVEGVRWDVQQAWDRQAKMLQAQSRSMVALKGMIKQYDEMINANRELATEERLTRIEAMKAQETKVKAEVARMTGEGMEVEDLSETDDAIYGD